MYPYPKALILASAIWKVCSGYMLYNVLLKSDGWSNCIQTNWDFHRNDCLSILKHYYSYISKLRLL